MRWTHIRSLSQISAVYSAYGLWIPVIAGILVARASSLAEQYPALALLNYPAAVASAIFIAMSGLFWTSFVIVCQVFPNGEIRDHKSQAEYLEKRQKAHSDADDWPVVFTNIVEKWESDDQIGLVPSILIGGLLLLSGALAVAGVCYLVLAVFPLLDHLLLQG